MKRTLGGFLALLVAAALGVVAPATARADSRLDNTSVKFTTDKAQAGTTLFGAMLDRSDRVYILVDDVPGISRMVFFLDSKETRTENFAPWELLGGEALEVSTLAQGHHKINVRVHFNDGGEKLLTSKFTVGSAGEPEPQPGDGPDPATGTVTNTSIVFGAVMRANPTVLFGKTLSRSDKVHVWLEAPATLQQVVFDLDGRIINTEKKHPWDMVREGSTLDLSGLANGEHTIHADVTFADGSVHLFTSRFTVSGDGGPLPTTEPTRPAKPEPARPEPTVGPGKPVTGQPTLHNTGPRKGHKLKKSGSITVSKKGAVIQNLDVHGRIVINADNVTIRDVRVRANTDSGAINIGHGVKGTLIEHVAIEMYGQQAAAGINVGGDYGGKRSRKAGDNITVRHSSVVGNGDGMKCSDYSLYEHNYIRVERYEKDHKAHVDGIQCSGRSHIVIRHNNIDQFRGPGQNAAVFVQAYNGQHHNTVRNIDVYGNWLDGGSYPFHSEDHKKLKGVKEGRWLSGVRVHDNFFGRDYRYAAYHFAPGVSGNAGVFADNGKPVK